MDLVYHIHSQTRSKRQFELNCSDWKWKIEFLVCILTIELIKMEIQIEMFHNNKHVNKISSYSFSN